MYSPLATPAKTIARLKELGFYTKKSLGQHFLIDDNIIGRILSLADVNPGDGIIEVGPGIGTLTLALQNVGALVVAIEYDQRLVRPLENIVDFRQVQVTQADAARIDSTSINEMMRSLAKYQSPQLSSGNDLDRACHKDSDVLPRDEYVMTRPLALVSNLPYQVAATVTLRYFEQLSNLTTATVMVQKEVADRMDACVGTKDYSGFSAKLQLLARCTGRFEVSRTSFLPPPKVESAVIKLDRISGDITNDHYRRASQLINAAFFSRRKTIRNNLIARLDETKQTIDAALEHCNIAPTQRAETISPRQFLQLAEALV